MIVDLRSQMMQGACASATSCLLHAKTLWFRRSLAKPQGQWFESTRAYQILPLNGYMPTALNSAVAESPY